LWNGAVEYRAKWQPSAEICLDGEVWECRMGTTLIPVRPRPGKVAMNILSVPARLRSCFRGNFVVPMMQDIQVVSPQMEFLTDATVYVGCKCLFVLPNWRVAFIRETEKRLDLIGGTMEIGEEPIGCIIRETQEETDVKMRGTDFFYLGPSKEQSDTGSWLSHVYLAFCPEEIASHAKVEIYNIDTFVNFKNSSHGRPRVVWMARHLDFLRDKLGNWQQAFVVCQQLWGISSQGSTQHHPTQQVWAMIKDQVSENYRRRKAAGFTRKEEIAFAEARNIYLNRELLNEHWPLERVEEKNVPSSPLEWKSKGTKVGVPTTYKVDLTKWSEGNMPSSVDECISSLLCLFPGCKRLPLSQFYNIIRSKGYKGPRKPLVKFVEQCEKHLLVSFKLLATGGREVEFAKFDGVQEEKSTIQAVSLARANNLQVALASGLAPLRTESSHQVRQMAQDAVKGGRFVPSSQRRD